jgi:hypothetical protein
MLYILCWEVVKGNVILMNIDSIERDEVGAIMLGAVVLNWVMVDLRISPGLFTFISRRFPVVILVIYVYPRLFY